MLENFKKEFIDPLPDPDSYSDHIGMECVIVDDRTSKDCLRAMKSVKALIPDAKIRHFKDPINSIEDHDLLLTSKEFWDRMSKNFVLIFQPDSLMLNPLKEKFFCDYVGAPWDLSRAMKFGWIGNGGFSLRRVSKMKEIVENQQYDLKKEHHEDTFFVKHLSTPTLDVGIEFSVEWHFYPTPCGIHDAEAHLSQRLVEKMLLNSKLCGK